MRKSIFSLFSVVLMLVSCHDKVSTDDTTDHSATYYANLFAYNIMSGYYLWNSEIAGDLASWPYNADPVAKVESLRYKDSSGNLVDKWTSLMEDCSHFLGSVTGNGKTFGFDYILYYMDANKKKICAVVSFTYENSPARNAGLRRGDVIVSIDGEKLTADNYQSILTEKMYNNASSVKLGLQDGSSISLTAVSMYSNPVNVVKVIGSTAYIHFSSFTLEAARDLVNTFLSLKEQGVEELVLDLRYNTGGYVVTGLVLASMIAPLSAVRDGAVFNRSIYNEDLSEIMDSEDCLAGSMTVSFSGGPSTLNTEEANLGLKRLWVITTGHSASASEALICGLKPYMDVILVGSTTYGKFCGGYLITAEQWYNAVAESDSSSIDAKEGMEATAGWGIYVIASRYADCNGVTLSMPSGIPADYEAYDDLRDGHELGDPSESMLAVVLSLIEGSPLTKAASGAPAVEEIPYDKPGNYVMLW